MFYFKSFSWEMKKSVEKNEEEMQRNSARRFRWSFLIQLNAQLFRRFFYCLENCDFYGMLHAARLSLQIIMDSDLFFIAFALKSLNSTLFWLAWMLKLSSLLLSIASLSLYLLYSAHAEQLTPLNCFLLAASHLFMLSVARAREYNWGVRK